jgi:hypothetical protein
MKHVKMLIGVLSCQKYAARREACLQTWANVQERNDVDVVFVVSSDSNEWPYREGNLLLCPCPDDYGSLSLKTRWLCLWAIGEVSFDYLFKCDDDTYVHIDRLLNCDTLGDYVGGDRHPHGHPSGGAGYRLTRNAAIEVATSLMTTASYEDWLVWKLLTSTGMPLRSDSRFIFHGERWPAQDNDLITCHRCSEQRMREIHDALYPSNPASSPRSLRSLR